MSRSVLLWVIRKDYLHLVFRSKKRDERERTQRTPFVCRTGRTTDVFSKVARSMLTINTIPDKGTHTILSQKNAVFWYGVLYVCIQVFQFQSHSIFQAGRCIPGMS